MFPLPSTWTYEARFPVEAGIPRLWDTSIIINSGSCMDTVCSFSPQCGPEEPVSVLGYCTRSFCGTNKIERLGYGSRSRTEFTGRRLQGPTNMSTLLHRRLIGHISRLYRVCFYSHVYGKEYYLILVHLIHLLLHRV